MVPDEVLAPPRPTPTFVDLLPTATDPRAELTEALQQPQAFIPPKYFYDSLGSRLFEAICELPEYPLMRTERAIVDAHVHEIAARIGPGSVLIDLGAGNCEKAERLFGWLAPTQYVAIDIAADFLRERLSLLAGRNPHHSILGVAQDFTQSIRLPSQVAQGSRTLFFPGSSIGNFAPDAAFAFLCRTRDACGDDGQLLLGVDLVKDKALLDLAYDDPLRVTAAFNLNVLRNVNALLRSDFDVAEWRHVAFFDPERSRIEMHVEARRDLNVCWPGAQRSFVSGERIHTENSYKYTPDSLRQMLRRAGYAWQTLYTDDAGGFAVALAGA
ncbi:MAG TPA: L-histidine N(alpha)-methyltransferase [Burkholderiaceae bacterium]|nr:L-histidine N(alpha)-methyltransferase [Burkholderiaceae bacterium]